MLSIPQTPMVESPAKPPAGLTREQHGDKTLDDARELRDTYKQFVGETFFGQMLKAMRASVGEPAYFHGGSAERQFQARLDQQIAQDLASTGAHGLADTLFESQFPTEARLLREAADAPLASLDNLRRR